MQRRRLGRSDLEVPAVTFGAWAIGGWAWGPSDDAAALAALRAGLDHGLSAIDTAPVYGFGHSERLVGQAIAGRRDEVVVMTKAGLVWEDRRGEFFFEAEAPDGRRLAVYRNARPDSLRAEVEASLGRLGIETIDLLQLHWPDSTTPVAESLGALAELRAQGKVREVGVSNFSVGLLAAAERALGDVPLASTQERYSLVARGLEDGVLPWAREHEVGVLAYSPLEQGLLSGKVGPRRAFPRGDARAARTTFSGANRARVNALLERVVAPIAARHDATVAQVVIAWTAAQPGITSALVGARTPEQARENARAGALELAPEDSVAIGQAFAGLELVPGGLRGLARRLGGWLRRGR